MAEITLKQPNGPYECTLDTGVMATDIRENFLGIRMIALSGETLFVCERDSGFEVRYEVIVDGEAVTTPWMEFKGGEVDTKKE